MLFIWKGKGFLSALFLLGGLGVFGAILTLAFGQDIFEQKSWLFGIGLFFSAALNWIGGRRINKRPLWFTKGRPFSLAELKARNTFCFLAMEYWSPPTLVLGLALLATGLLHANA